MDEIKIDKAFVRDMATNDNDLAIVKATISLAHDLGFNVVAEGVEDQRTLDLLRAMDCDVPQGFHLSRPVPPAALIQVVTRLALASGPAQPGAPAAVAG